MTAATLVRPRQELHADNFRLAVEELLREVEREAEQAFAPKIVRSTAQWAEEERILPRSSSSEGGPFRNARVPYMRGIMDALDDTRAQTVVNMKGAQVAGSTIGENWVGRTMQDDPVPMIAVWPTEKLLRRWSLKRLTPMINDTPGLARLFARSGLRDAADSIGHKEFPNGSLDLLTARSSSDLRSISAQRIWFSEVDNIIGELAEDGDPFELARSRGETFWDYKEYLESTPTVAGASRIFDELTRSSWNDWHMPCPHCRELIVLRWRDGMESGDDDVSGEARFVWEEDGHGEVKPGTVQYICDRCACLIPEWHKASMLGGGLWIPRHPDRMTIVGFHIPAFISPLISWTRIAQRFVRAKRSEARMRTFVNNICGLPYRERASNVSAHFLLQRAEPYRAPVPEGVKVLVAGGDVQLDSVHLTVWGIGAGEEKWLVEWKILDGPISRRRVQSELAQFLSKAWRDTQGRARTVSATCIDGKYLTEYVLRFCRNFVGPRGAKVIPIQGKEGRGRPVIAELAPETRRRRRASKLRMVGIDGIKDMLMERLQLLEPGPGFLHFPIGLDPAFYVQLTAEELKTEYDRRRRPRRAWRKKSRDIANEVWDTLVYAYAGLVSLGPRVLQELAILAARETLEKAEPAEVVTAARSDTDPPPDDAPPASGVIRDPRPPKPKAPVNGAPRRGGGRARGRVRSRGVY